MKYMAKDDLDETALVSTFFYELNAEERARRYRERRFIGLENPSLEDMEKYLDWHRNSVIKRTYTWFNIWYSRDTPYAADGIMEVLLDNQKTVKIVNIVLRTVMTDLHVASFANLKLSSIIVDVCISSAQPNRCLSGFIVQLLNSSLKRFEIYYQNKTPFLRVPIGIGPSINSCEKLNINESLTAISVSSRAGSNGKVEGEWSEIMKKLPNLQHVILGPMTSELYQQIKETLPKYNVRLISFVSHEKNYVESNTSENRERRTELMFNLFTKLLVIGKVDCKMEPRFYRFQKRGGEVVFRKGGYKKFINETIELENPSKEGLLE